MIAGSDRVKVFDAMLNQYNGVEGKAHGYYKFDSIKIVNAGERDPDSEGVEGMSASKMRVAAADGDMDSFLQGVPSGFADGKKLYRDVRRYMGIREERDMGDMTDFETVRDAYLTGKIWNVGDIVEANGLVGEVVRKGTNYLSFMTEDNKVHKAWLHEIELNEFVSLVVGAGVWLGGVAAALAVRFLPEITFSAVLVVFFYQAITIAQTAATAVGLASPVVGAAATAGSVLAKGVMATKLMIATQLAIAFLPHFFSLLATGISITVALKQINIEAKKKIDGMTSKEIAKLPAKSSDKAKINKAVKSKPFKLMMKKAKIREEFMAEEITLIEVLDILNELKGLTPQTIKKLQKSFKNIRKFNPDSPSGEAIVAFIQDRSDDDLRDIIKEAFMV